MKNKLIFVLFMTFLFQSPVSGSEHFLNYGDDPGSHYYWKYGKHVGSKHYWQYGNKAGSEYYWVYGKKLGSKHFWDYGKEAGSQHYWNYGKEAGSKHYWEFGKGPGSKHFWKYGKTESFVPFFVSLCKGKVIEIEPCDKINTPPLSDLLEIQDQLQNLMLSPRLGTPPNINNSEGMKEIENPIRNNTRTNSSSNQ